MKSDLWRITSCVLDVALLRDLTTFLSLPMSFSTNATSYKHNSFHTVPCMYVFLSCIR